MVGVLSVLLESSMLDDREVWLECEAWLECQSVVGAMRRWRTERIERWGDVRHGWRVCEAGLEVRHGWRVVGVRQAWLECRGVVGVM